MAARHKRGNGEGSVWQLEDGRWRGAVHNAGVRRYVRGRTRREVVERLDALRQAESMGSTVGPARLTVGAVMDEWLAGRRLSVAPSTLISYTSIVETWLRPRLGAERIRTLGPGAIERVLVEVAATRSPRRVRYVREIARAVCEHAVKRGLLARNPVLLVDLPSDRARVEALGAPDPTARRVFSTEEVAVLLDGTRGDRLWSLFVVAAVTGARQGELFALTWPDVDMAGRSLTIRRSLGVDLNGHPAWQAPKTRSSHRTIRLPVVAVEALQVQAERQTEERAAASSWADLGLVFSSDRGTPLNSQNVLRSLRASLDRLALPAMRFHDLRHYAATEALANGIPPHEVAAYLGHATPAVTLTIYAHVSPRGANRTAEVFDWALGAGRIGAAS